MIAVVDYGMANLRSVEKALAAAGGAPFITSDPGDIARADKVVLPGVGAFCAAMQNLERSGLKQAVTEAIRSGKPFLGICLGLQMLFAKSTEMGGAEGLGILGGAVIRFFEDAPQHSQQLKVPHIGWNSITPNPASRLLHGICAGERVYFVHSFYPEPERAAVVSATSDYGGEFCCAVEVGNIAATQFHPERAARWDYEYCETSSPGNKYKLTRGFS